MDVEINEWRKAQIHSKHFCIVVLCLLMPIPSARALELMEITGAITIIIIIDRMSVIQISRMLSKLAN